MNENTRRGLLVAGLILNIVMLALALVDHAKWDGDYAVYIFVAWIVLVLLLVLLSFASWSPSMRTERVVEFRDAPASTFRPVAPAPAPKAAAATGPFQFNGYTLYGRDVQLKGEGRSRTIYFFAKSTPKSGRAIPKPDGFHVGVNERTGLPFLKKGAGRDGEDLTPGPAEAAPRPQCAAITGDDKQCKNPSREGSKYCSSHFGYQPSEAKTIRAVTGQAVAKADTRPRYGKTPDTKPSVRKRSTA